MIVIFVVVAKTTFEGGNVYDKTKKIVTKKILPNNDIFTRSTTQGRGYGGGGGEWYRVSFYF